MPITRLHTGFNIEIEFTISAFHKRLIAWFIDLIVLYLYIWICRNLLRSFSIYSLFDDFSLVEFLLWMPVLFYFLVFELVTNGQTPGKKIMRIKVIAANGGQASLSQYLIRWTFRLIDFPFWLFLALANSYWPGYLFPFLFTGLACFILSKKSQRIGDLLADTIVIDTNTESHWQQTVFTEVEDVYTPQFPSVMNLSDRDMNTIKQVLIYLKKKPNDPVLFKVALKIQTALKIETDLEAAEFLEVLLKDYNYISRQQ